ncbi:MAG: DNA recombination protein RmuC [Clostridia bacterium]|nr:DNA recombination protein RmuC [Clostridia bacterium]
MTEPLLIICIVLLIICICLLLGVLFKKPPVVGKIEGADTIKEKIDTLGGVANYTNQSIANLSSMTEYRLNNMQKNLNEQLQYISANNQRAVDEIRMSVNEKLSETLETKLNESYSVIQQRLDAVTRGIGEVHSLAEGVSDIKKVFSNVKLRGTWGETQLGALLSQMLAPNQYAANVKINPLSDQMVDFAVVLPDKSSETVYLPIDSKFPIEEYKRLIDATNLCDKDAEEKAVKSLARAIKLQADSIATKYILPPRTTDFAVMYLPLESLYAEALKIPELSDYLALRRILICGPTNLSALLSTLQTGFKVSAIEKRSQEIWQLLSVFKHEFSKFSDVLDKTQKKLQEAQDSIETAAGRTRAIAKKLKNVDMGITDGLLSAAEKNIFPDNPNGFSE